MEKIEKLVINNITPIYNSDSKILILGTIPSVKSREYNFFYSHPKNRFWNIMRDLFLEDIAFYNFKELDTNEKKRDFLFFKRIALWDVLKSCSINGSDDGSIRNPEINDLKIIFDTANIKAVFTTGMKATTLYNKYCIGITNMMTTYLPSTSPANCRKYKNYDDLLKEYSIILNYLK